MMSLRLSLCFSMEPFLKDFDKTEMLQEGGGKDKLGGNHENMKTNS